MYKRALVTLDGSVLAEAIVPFIVEIAGPLDLEIVLLRVLPAMPPVSEGSAVMVKDIDAWFAEGREYLAAVAARLAANGIRVRTDVRRGEPAREIVDAARESGADLIAMTTHGRSGLGRLLFGSVAEAVLRDADVPVFLMRLTEKQVAARAAHAVAG